MSMPEVLSNLRKRPGMYLTAQTYDAAVAFVNGYDAGTGGGLLIAFREWLVPRLGDGNNLAWSGLVRELFQRSDQPAGDATDDRAAIEFMMATLDAFLRERGDRGGMRRIYLRYEAWLRQQDWYTPSSPDWNDSP